MTKIQVRERFGTRKENDMQMNIETLAKYEANPAGMDSEIRKALNIQENRYYSVTLFPKHTAGRITLTGERIVRAHKISKSDSQ